MMRWIYCIEHSTFSLLMLFLSSDELSSSTRFSPPSFSCIVLLDLQGATLARVRTCQAQRSAQGGWPPGNPGLQQTVLLRPRTEAARHMWALRVALTVVYSCSAPRKSTSTADELAFLLPECVNKVLLLIYCHASLPCAQSVSLT